MTALRINPINIVSLAKAIVHDRLATDGCAVRGLAGKIEGTVVSAKVFVVVVSIVTGFNALMNSGVATGRYRAVVKASVRFILVAIVTTLGVSI
jgi:hypothetical protein